MIFVKAKNVQNVLSCHYRHYADVRIINWAITHDGWRHILAHFTRDNIFWAPGEGCEGISQVRPERN
jgi:hypothetical protein